MKTKKIFFSSIIIIMVVSVSILFLVNSEKSLETNYAELEEMEEAPTDQEEGFHPDNLSPTEFKAYKKWKDELEASGYNFSKLNKSKLKSHASNTRTSEKVSLKESYANGKLTGTWEHKYFETSRSGFRVDGSAYDPVNDEIYAVSYAGHLYKIDRNAVKKWLLRNHKGKFKGEDLAGVNLSNGNFRLIHQQKDGGAEYSDDEGRTWNVANGALFENGWNHKTVVTNYQGGKRIVAHGSNYSGSTGYHRLFLSTDYGKNYTQSSQSWSRDSYDVIICKPHNSDNVYAFARNKSSQKIDIYRCTSSQSDFTLLRTTSQSFSALEKVHGTNSGGKYHFYVHGDAKDIYYSSNEGSSWTHNIANNSKKIREIHPNQPNIAFKGFTAINKTTDYGATWASMTHNLGDYYVWDLHHMQVYERTDGSDFMFVGLDFGCFISDTPEDPNTYEELNHGTPILMCYDAASSEIYNTGYAATQDRGCKGYVDVPKANGLYGEGGIAATDILRVTLAKNEQSVWYWRYTGQIGHVYNTNPIDKTGEKKKDFFGKWSATTMVASPDQTEDAVYIANGTQLLKVSYDAGSNTVSGTNHPYVFPDKAVSFGYSTVNTNRWYVALLNKDFYYSTDGSNSFTKTSYSGALPGQAQSWNKSRQVIIASKSDENIVYFAGRGNKFLISNDGGQTFTSHVNGLDIDRVRDLDVTPDDKFVFAACASAGPKVFSVEDDMWYSLESDATPSADYTDVQYLTSKNIVRFATYGSGVLDFHLDGTAPPVIADPDGLDATTVSESQINLSWNDNSNNEDGFKIEQSTDGNNYSEIATVGANVSSYNNTGLAASTTYYYKVRAYQGSYNSNYSNVASATTDAEGGGIPPSGSVVFIDHKSSSDRLKAAGTNKNDDIVLTSTSSTGTDVQWELIAISGTPHYYLVNQASNRRFYATDGGDVQVGGTSWSGDNVRWEIIDIDGTWFYINHKKTGLRLHASSDEGWVVNLKATSNTGDNVRWKFTSVPKSAGVLTSIDENALQILNVMPNPAQDMITINGLIGTQTVQVYTLSGNLVLTDKTNGELDISKLSSGVYILKSNKSEPVKFIKK